MSLRPKKKRTRSKGLTKKEVREIHARRKPQARQSDEGKAAPIAKTHRDWAAQPNRLDIEGVDYPEIDRLLKEVKAKRIKKTRPKGVTKAELAKIRRTGTFRSLTGNKQLEDIDRVIKDEGIGVIKDDLIRYKSLCSNPDKVAQLLVQADKSWMKSKEHWEDVERGKKDRLLRLVELRKKIRNLKTTKEMQRLEQQAERIEAGTKKREMKAVTKYGAEQRQVRDLVTQLSGPLTSSGARAASARYDRPDLERARVERRVWADVPEHIRYTYDYDWGRKPQKKEYGIFELRKSLKNTKPEIIDREAETRAKRTADKKIVVFQNEREQTFYINPDGTGLRLNKKEGASPVSEKVIEKQKKSTKRVYLTVDDNVTKREKHMLHFAALFGVKGDIRHNELRAPTRDTIKQLKTIAEERKIPSSGQRGLLLDGSGVVGITTAKWYGGATALGSKANIPDLENLKKRKGRRVVVYAENKGRSEYLRSYLTPAVTFMSAPDTQWHFTDLGRPTSGKHDKPLVGTSDKMGIQIFIAPKVDRLRKPVKMKRD